MEGEKREPTQRCPTPRPSVRRAGRPATPTRRTPQHRASPIPGKIGPPTPNVTPNARRLNAVAQRRHGQQRARPQHRHDEQIVQNRRQQRAAQQQHAHAAGSKSGDRVRRNFSSSAAVASKAMSISAMANAPNSVLPHGSDGKLTQQPRRQRRSPVEHVARRIVRGRAVRRRRPDNSSRRDGSTTSARYKVHVARLVAFQIERIGQRRECDAPPDTANAAIAPRTRRACRRFSRA